MKKFIRKIILSAFFICTGYLFAQEALKSMEEEYYEFLSLTGVTERPSLGYRTLSDSVWLFNDIETLEENEDGTYSKINIAGAESTNNIWKDVNLGRTYTLWAPSNPPDNWLINGIKQAFTVRVYGPEWYNSFNTKGPYGQNDGALWQGKGYNTSFTSGIRLEGYGFEFTFRPQLTLSQNMDFRIMDNSAYYSNRFAYIWGYGSNIGADAPQRFGDKSFFTFDFGDTEARWSWYSFTVGFGTETIWLGPAWQNPLLHSNNAGSYPKFDIGLRKTSVIIPFVDWNLGEIEARIWIGRLSESKYFDEDETNNHNQITGLTFSYAPSFLPGLSLGINKISLSKWNKKEVYKYLNPFYGMKGSAYGNVAEDQKISFILDWLIPKGGIDTYAEFGIDDHINYKDTINSYVTHYWHTFTYTFGIKKEIPLSKKREVSSEIIFEWNNTEMSQDFQTQWSYSFGFHHQITQGYTNKGQWLGSGIGYGGQSQYLGYKVYYPKGYSMLFVNRYNPDNNFNFKEAIYDVAGGESGALHERTWNYYKGVLAIGLQTTFFTKEGIILGGGITYARIVNPLYNQSATQYEVWNNIQLQFTAKYNF